MLKMHNHCAIFALDGIYGQSDEIAHNSVHLKVKVCQSRIAGESEASASHNNAHPASQWRIQFLCALCRLGLPDGSNLRAGWAQRKNSISRTLGQHPIWLSTNVRSKISFRRTIATIWTSLVACSSRAVKQLRSEKHLRLGERDRIFIGTLIV